MKDQVIMNKDGALAVAVPLYRLVQDSTLDRIDGYVICFNDSEPIGYAVDLGDTAQLINADFLKKSGVEWLGDL